MRRITFASVLALSFAALLGTTAPAAAKPLFSRSTAGHGALAGVRDVERIVLDREALADLRGREHAVVPGFPLGRRRTADLELTRIAPFDESTYVEVMERAGPRRLTLPDRVYFAGTVVGENGSRVFLAAGPDRAHGFVVSDGDVYPFGPDGRGGHRTYALRDVDPLVYPPPGDFCANDLHPDQVDAAPAGVEALVAPPVADAPTALKLADVAIETDQELRAKFTTDQAALDYLASLAAASSAIYERDVAVRLRFSYIRLWSTADPWTATDTSGQLTELRSYWNNAANGMTSIAGPRTVVHFVSGKPVQGGIAYVNVLCNQSYGYGVSQVNGSFDLSRPSAIWDVMVVSHELGHNFGSPHSHCYSPPIDRCYNAESGCYSGPVVMTRGTIMSYCHLNGAGLQNIDLVFGSVVSDRIGQSVASASCLGTVATTSTSSTSTTSTTTRPPTTTTSTTRPPITTTSSSTSTTTRPPTTSTSSTTTRPPTTSTSSTTASTSTSTTASTSSTTSTTISSTGDADGDGIPDRRDDCPGTPLGDLVDSHGCSVCPCTGPTTGGLWSSAASYVRCVRLESKRQLDVGQIGRQERRGFIAAARRSTCSRAGMTRCCVYDGAQDAKGRCRITSEPTCELQSLTLDGADLGPGTCVPTACARPIVR